MIINLLKLKQILIKFQLKYVLDYNNVAAAKVVGAGDDIMFRDGGYIDTYGEYHWGSGGCMATIY